VSEAEIAIAKAQIGSDGIGCEPASAVTLAGLKKLVAIGFVKPHERIVLILTGHVLKDPDFTIKFHRGELPAGAPRLSQNRRPPVALEANADAILKTLEQHERSQA